MVKFGIELNEVKPTKTGDGNRTNYDRAVNLAKVVSACPFTKQQLEELESIWNINRNFYLSSIDPGWIDTIFYTGDNKSEFIMENSIRPIFKGHDGIFFKFDECFVKGILICKILKKWESTLSEMESDILKVTLIQIELLRFKNVSQSNVTVELSVSIEALTKILRGNGKDVSIEQMLKHLNVLSELEEYVETVELNGNEAFIMKFHKPFDYDLEKLDIFDSLISTYSQQ